MEKNCTTSHTILGLETHWLKDGQPLSDLGGGRYRTFESRGVRGVSIRGVRDEDQGVYALRVVGEATNLFTSCRVNVQGW